MQKNFVYLENPNGSPVKAWVKGVPFDPGTEQQLRQVASMPFIHHHVAAMPDCHLGKGSTVGCVLPTRGAIIPAAVGVDIGCGMVAVRTSLKAHELPDDLKPLRDWIESVVPVGSNDWGHSPFQKMQVTRFRRRAEREWKPLEKGYLALLEQYPRVAPPKNHPVHQVGSLGGGNHFIEICLDEADRVWVMLHSGSRGIGNRIGSFFIEAARHEMERLFIHLPDRDLAYLAEGSDLFDDYVQAVEWAQHYAYSNREVMLENVLAALEDSGLLPPFESETEVVNCHHNYIAREHHFNANIWVTRKGAIRARAGDLGIIPGSMGARSFIVRGKGEPESFDSCSHGAGRTMSRAQAKKRFSLEDHLKATQGVECRKDLGVLDETPAAYKDIDAVMQAQSDLVEIVHTLKQVVCVKG
ncbi:RNA-splicing ligase RtcB [bacterium (Candidatus Blackallbacteria) CG17_big_fil_post_rev_8_21_14_2_50_48_46]|uniref:3'-phosphate/5'-hydroxy nucleic acid ligase n=1 Tax=bacterium (Candidatus Blackallbacteria) CG17_big_fil_post_rev_8_21_14_2_50_48_46 TaxID=2014261 RepID=A0A2M7G0H3_9BACT|nr:MAG: RNA-splicing ligase RtcB [bacterium (Candidatus Blackallbacteria) CG18_big_fil_WC_8_21_14_2_50_49_26]PIW15218.1 MAG: RNA-splicing ligase RtcB [bacterium (Candidatus Blackallbacteria) CG17_big_fil_post_rev_8_21_14_2_50_48_46]PIW44805.1 MAG: RNA-splicing ligase RtcB [bacterium (Candidatus Blackallbacteria) CG13_big_fil_rev_8_21_14_2_50_49_14]